MKREYVRQLKNGSYRNGATRDVCIGDYEIALRASRLRCRVLIAPNVKAFRRLYKAVCPHTWSRNARGVCSPLSYYVQDIRKNGEEGPMREVFDPRYFACIILCATKCPVEIVTHECGHAAIFYATRIKNHTWGGNVKAGQENRDDERICYPLGLLCTAVFRTLYKAGVWKAENAATYRQR